MKKTITKPDGTVIVYEGTAEEIERLERGEVKPIEVVPGIPVPNLIPWYPPQFPGPYSPLVPQDSKPWPKPFEVWCWNKTMC